MTQSLCYQTSVITWPLKRVLIALSNCFFVMVSSVVDGRTLLHAIADGNREIKRGEGKG
jgi:hypothetical protein